MDELKRIRNIRENAKVSVVIDRYDEDWSELRYVIIQGEARCSRAATSSRAARTSCSRSIRSIAPWGSGATRAS